MQVNGNKYICFAFHIKRVFFFPSNTESHLTVNNNHGSCLIIIRYNLLISFLFCLSVNNINSHTLLREKKYGTISFLTHIHQLSKHAAARSPTGKRLRRFHFEISPSCRVFTISVISREQSSTGMRLCTQRTWKTKWYKWQLAHSSSQRTGNREESYAADNCPGAGFKHKNGNKEDR